MQSKLLYWQQYKKEAQERGFYQLSMHKLIGEFERRLLCHTTAEP